jgi:hypothetical protein
MVALFTIEASPTTAGALEPDALGEGDAEALADEDGDGEELADGEAELDALAAGAALSLVADSACPEPPLLLGDGLDEAFAEELADALGDVLADPDGDADELGEAELLGDGAVRSAAGAHCVPIPLHSSTWRNRSSAVVPTRSATFCAPAPGTDTVMY